MDTVRSVRNCLPQFKFVCPRQWEDLAETGDAGVRFCAQCERQVHLCITDEQTLAHARAGDCIARSSPAGSALPQVFVGEPDAVHEPPTPEQMAAAELSRRERAIDDVLAWDLASYSRACPSCSFPVPNFRATCRVCDTAVGRR